MTTYACTGNPPKATPCATEIRSEKAAEDHAKTGHAVASATSPAVVERFVAAAWALCEEAS